MAEQRWWQGHLQAMAPQARYSIVPDGQDAIVYANFPLPDVPMPRLSRLVDGGSKDLLRLAEAAFREPGRVFIGKVESRQEPCRVRAVNLENLDGSRRTLIFPDSRSAPPEPLGRSVRSPRPKLQLLGAARRRLARTD